MDPADAADDLLGTLLDRVHLTAPDEVAATIVETSAEWGWTVSMFLADHEQRQLVPIDAGAATFGPQTIDGTLAGRCFRSTEVVGSGDPPAPHWWVPLLDGVDRLGVLRIEMDGGRSLEEPRTRDVVRWYAHLVAHLVASKSNYGDTLHLARVHQPRTDPSELIWSLLPPLTVACHGLAISGSLHPVHSVAGDIFDYAIDGGVAHIAIADASGHDANSALIGAMVLAAYRASRRQGLDLVDTAAHVDAALSGLGDTALASAVFGRLDIATGRFSYLSAGHPSPLLLRDSKVIKSLDAGRRILLGVPGYGGEVAVEQLEPGDTIVMYTDGVTEARDEHRGFFGLERLIEVVEHSAADDQVTPETVRRAAAAVLDHQHGVLQDDATLVVVEWKSKVERRLRST
jgi:serine phosphatase RsbU (regulator of sigma subunit)